jgi:ParB family chromosome partitioning protein
VSLKKGLGRGFESLIPTELIDESLDPTALQDEQLSELKQLSIDDVVANPEQPRRSFDEDALAELVASINEHGIIQPIIVTPRGGSFQIVAGERRYRAARQAGLKKIPALVRSMDDQQQLEISLIENLQRKDLNVLETATAYLKLRDQFNMTLEQIGQRVGGRSSSAISNTLRLLRLPEHVRELLKQNKLSEGQARPLLGINREDLDILLPKILHEDWSARRIEQYIVELKKNNVSQKKYRVDSSSYSDKVAVISARLQTEVQVRSSAKGSGKLVISFKNDTEFDRITKLLS